MRKPQKIQLKKNKIKWMPGLGATPREETVFHLSEAFLYSVAILLVCGCVCVCVCVRERECVCVCLWR
jgi:hypothetical protein